MLVLSRRTSERIIIGRDICITVVAVKGSKQVRLGIEAPPHISVQREELLDEGGIEGPAAGTARP